MVMIRWMAVLYMSLMVQVWSQTAAGIVLYCEKPDGVWVLVADHKMGKRGFASFGGSYEKGETYQETAARETSEETRGYFKQEDLLKGIAGQKGVDYLIYRMFFLKVPFVEAAEIEKRKGAGVMDERFDYVWVPEKELSRYFGVVADLQTPLKLDPAYLPKKAKTDYYWRLWLGQMAEAQRRGAFPWQKKKAGLP
ncbi:8-oxo-dGTP pyrophosphatase MutT, NUDIX family [Rubritalea squalenifaciens DSM 18772]|uniref:8-oxo-dGTP pyrophosphatase MutT, NUDIX family n=2 Tax=Rubritalea squalenifaciens TaxID=407226 RepID=A0A1M6RSH5_9BACT|nr:8-oxo-dGTP pyrophosphatase MutT, NUDIX family [Rubritalea squalenifaciens DSM 18772]